VTEIDAKLAELLWLRVTRVDLAECCHGDYWPDRPIPDDLAGDAAAE